MTMHNKTVMMRSQVEWYQRQLLWLREIWTRRLLSLSLQHAVYIFTSEYEWSISPISCPLH